MDLSTSKNCVEENSEINEIKDLKYGDEQKSSRENSENENKSGRPKRLRELKESDKSETNDNSVNLRVPKIKIALGNQEFTRATDESENSLKTTESKPSERHSKLRSGSKRSVLKRNVSILRKKDSILSKLNESDEQKELKATLESIPASVSIIESSSLVDKNKESELDKDDNIDSYNSNSPTCSKITEDDSSNEENDPKRDEDPMKIKSGIINSLTNSGNSNSSLMKTFPVTSNIGGVRLLGGSNVRGATNMPLLVMPGSGQGLSLLPAGLPPGRYVILPSSSSSSTSSTSTSTSVITCTTTTPTTTVPVSFSTTPTPRLSPRVASCSTPGGVAGTTRHVVGTAGRGRRKSYTAAEKLAMIEAVEAGQKKSVVADRFGVAPSTLACILLQKNKIRFDQVCKNNVIYHHFLIVDSQFFIII